MIPVIITLELWEEMRPLIGWLGKNRSVRVVAEKVGCTKHGTCLLLLKSDEGKKVSDEQQQCMIDQCVMLLQALGATVAKIDIQTKHLEGEGPKHNPGMN